MSDWTNVMVEFEKDLKKADTIRPETFTADQEWFLCRHVVTEATSTVKTEGSSAKLMTTLCTIKVSCQKKKWILLLEYCHDHSKDINKFNAFL